MSEAEVEMPVVNGSGDIRWVWCYGGRAERRRKRIVDGEMLTRSVVLELKDVDTCRYIGSNGRGVHRSNNVSYVGCGI